MYKGRRGSAAIIAGASSLCEAVTTNTLAQGGGGSFNTGFDGRNSDGANRGAYTIGRFKLGITFWFFKKKRKEERNELHN